MREPDQCILRELWVFVSPIIRVNNDIEDFGEVVIQIS
jgi:hypothetical protein